MENFVTRDNLREFEKFFEDVMYYFYNWTSFIDDRNMLATDLKKVTNLALRSKFQKRHPDRKDAITDFVLELYEALHEYNSPNDRISIFDNWLYDYNPNESSEDIDGDILDSMFVDFGGKEMYEKVDELANWNDIVDAEVRNRR